MQWHTKPLSLSSAEKPRRFGGAEGKYQSAGSSSTESVGAVSAEVPAVTMTPATVAVTPTWFIIGIVPIAFDELPVAPTVTITSVMPVVSTGMAVAAKSAAMTSTMVSTMPTR